MTYSARADGVLGCQETIRKLDECAYPLVLPLGSCAFACSAASLARRSALRRSVLARTAFISVSYSGGLPVVRCSFANRAFARSFRERSTKAISGPKVAIFGTANSVNRSGEARE